MGALYHFTCSHAAPHIDRARALVPQVSWRHLDSLLLERGEPMTGLWRAPAVVWLTDMRSPDRDALGLTSRTLKCDRTEFRYTVETDAAEPWLAFARRYDASPEYLARLPGKPGRWFVMAGRVPVIEKLDRRSGSALSLGDAAQETK
jgi:hypothetical protein